MEFGRRRRAGLVGACGWRDGREWRVAGRGTGCAVDRDLAGGFHADPATGVDLMEGGQTARAGVLAATGRAGDGAGWVVLDRA